MHTTRLPLLFTCLALSGVALPLEARPLKVAVLELGNQAGLAGAEIRYLTDVVRASALRLPADRFFVLTRQNILAHLPPGVELESCEGTCEVETARNVGADRVVSGEIVRLGSELRVALRLHEVGEGRLLAASRGAAVDAAALETPLGQAADALLAGLAAAPAGVEGASASARPPPAARAMPPTLAPPPRRARSLPPGLSWQGFAGGPFTRGDTGRGGSATPEQAVTVGGFSLTRGEITVAQFLACVRDGACTPASTASPRCTRAGDLPITCVTAPQAEAFCAWVGGRLPSETEWEYAARGGGKPSNPLSFLQRDLGCEQVVMRDGRGPGCGRNRPAPACSRPSVEGVCDLLGNVAEWVADCWHADYRGAPRDGRPWTHGCHGRERVIRGGSYADDRTTVHPAERRSRPPEQARVDLGFRCAR